MELYKFRSLANFDRIENIIATNEFYLADWRRLNDPMEGHFNVLYKDDPSYQRLLQDFINYKIRLKICSFSRTFKHILLWSHYADQHNGIAIGIKYPKLINNKLNSGNILYENLHKVEYLQNIPAMDLKLHPLPVNVLTKKINIWSYEQEYRYISEEQYARIGQVNKIYLGLRTSEYDKSRIRELVSDLNIIVYETTLDFRNNHVIVKP